MKALNDVENFNECIIIEIQKYITHANSISNKKQPTAICRHTHTCISVVLETIYLLQDLNGHSSNQLCHVL